MTRTVHIHFIIIIIKCQVSLLQSLNLKKKVSKRCRTWQEQPIGICGEKLLSVGCSSLLNYLWIHDLYSYFKMYIKRLLYLVPSCLSDIYVSTRQMHTVTTAATKAMFPSTYFYAHFGIKNAGWKRPRCTWTLKMCIKAWMHSTKLENVQVNHDGYTFSE